MRQLSNRRSTARWTLASVLFVVLVAAFATGFLLVPQTAEACIINPACPGSGCVWIYKGCSCGLSGDRWEEKITCVDNGQVIKWTCGYVCAP